MGYRIHPDKVYLAVFAIFLVGAVVKYSAEVVCAQIWNLETIDHIGATLESTGVIVGEFPSKYEESVAESDHI